MNGPQSPSNKRQVGRTPRLETLNCDEPVIAQDGTGRELIYPLADGMHVIYAANSLLPWGPINFVHDQRPENRRLKRFPDKGPFFSTNHPWNNMAQFMVFGCNSLEELEEMTYALIKGESFPIIEKVAFGSCSNKLFERAIREVTDVAKARSARDYFLSVGSYFRPLSQYDSPQIAATL